MKGKSWKISVLRRLIISFICILLPIYILSIYMYNTGLMILRQEISNSMASQVSFYLERLEKEVQRIRILQFELLNDKDINRMAAIPQALSNIEKTESLLRIQNRMFAIKNSSVYIESASMMLPSAGKIVSSESISNLDYFEFDKMKSFSISPDSGIIYMDDSMYLVVAYPFRYMTEKEPILAINIELSEKAFEDALRVMINNPDEGIILYNLDNSMTISSGNNAAYHNDIIRFVKEKNGYARDHAQVAIIGGTRYLVVFKASEYFNLVLCKYVPEKSVFEPLRKYYIWVFVFTGSAILIVVIYSIYLYKFIHKPLSRLAESFKLVKTGNFEIHIEHEHDDEFRFIYLHFNSMVEELGLLINQAYKQKMLIQKAEMKQLQSQINPHFLYNSFFILNTMARIRDYENLERFTEQLGRYYQFITRNASNEVALKNEVDHARIYTEIQAMRFSNRVKVDFEQLPQKYSEILVPRLILQPIIENAFEHGLSMKKSDGVLNVRFEEKENKLNITVENNGEELTNAKMKILYKKINGYEYQHEEVTALQNIHQRLKLKFGPGYGLSFNKGSCGGVKVNIIVPTVKKAGA